jgi:hypothetical protein
MLTRAKRAVDAHTRLENGIRILSAQDPRAKRGVDAQVADVDPLAAFKKMITLSAESNRGIDQLINNLTTVCEKRGWVSIERDIAERYDFEVDMASMQIVLSAICELATKDLSDLIVDLVAELYNAPLKNVKGHPFLAKFGLLYLRSDVSSIEKKGGAQARVFAMSGVKGALAELFMMMALLRVFPKVASQFRVAIPGRDNTDLDVVGWDPTHWDHTPIGVEVKMGAPAYVQEQLHVELDKKTGLMDGHIAKQVVGHLLVTSRALLLVPLECKPRDINLKGVLESYAGANGVDIAGLDFERAETRVVYALPNVAPLEAAIEMALADDSISVICKALAEASAARAPKVKKGVAAAAANDVPVALREGVREWLEKQGVGAGVGERLDALTTLNTNAMFNLLSACGDANNAHVADISRYATNVNGRITKMHYIVLQLLVGAILDNDDVVFGDVASPKKRSSAVSVKAGGATLVDVDEEKKEDITAVNILTKGVQETLCTKALPIVSMLSQQWAMSNVAYVVVRDEGGVADVTTFLQSPQRRTDVFEDDAVVRDNSYVVHVVVSPPVADLTDVCIRLCAAREAKETKSR